MGDFAVKSLQERTNRQQYLIQLLTDVQALEKMLHEGLFEKDKRRIGAEQELCVVDDAFDPSYHGPDILSRIPDDHFTSEIARYNLEINLDPFEFRSDCLRRVERQLIHLLGQAEAHASDADNHILLAGILPTIHYDHLQPEWMTPQARYRMLSELIREMRGKDFEIHIQGVDELIASLNSVLFEACNTSFQLHLQVPADRFVQNYNWAQLISGPVLAAAANSPLLLGRELWMETRIALFQQSIDTRSSINHLREKQARVFFGRDWLRGSVAELYKEQITRFPIILGTEQPEDSLQMLTDGQTPKLSALGMHNGTVYTWNRPCYGRGNGRPHLRIECRYLPSGPSAGDEMANFAFWLGLMNTDRSTHKNFTKTLPFTTVRDNFYRAAKMGLHTVFDWFGRSITARELILQELLPMAENGLQALQINQDDISRYLGTIHQRVEKEQNGAAWQVKNFRKLKECFNVGVGVTELTRGMYERQRAGLPVHEWPDIDCTRHYVVNLENETVDKLMSTDLFTVREHEPVALVDSIMRWRKIRHLPVESMSGEIIGVVTATNLKPLRELAEDWSPRPIREIMVKEVITVSPNTPLRSAVQLMRTYGIGCLPVLVNKKLVGLLTDTDLKKVPNLLKAPINE